MTNTNEVTIESAFGNLFDVAGGLTAACRVAVEMLKTGESFEDAKERAESMLSVKAAIAHDNGDDVEARTLSINSIMQRYTKEQVRQGKMKAALGVKLITRDDESDDGTAIKRHSIEITFPKMRNVEKKEKNRFLVLAGKINAGSITLDEYAEFMVLVSEKKPS